MKEEHHPKPVTKNCMEIILNQINNSICWINKKEGEWELAFFVCLKYRNQNIPVLMTNYHFMNGYNDKTLNISVNNKNKIIKLGNKRYKNKKYNIFITEIIEDKNDKIKYLKIDDNLFIKENEILYNKESIYIIQSDANKDISVSFGKIDGIVEPKIKYSCYINKKSKFLPIFNLCNNKILGIHENISDYYYYKGILLKDIIKEFFIENKYEKNDKNEIALLINVDNNEINKKIYFIDNYDNNHDNLKELNELNTELYIDNNNYKFNKYFIPKYEGKYNIKLKFSFNVTDCSYMFAKCKNIININFSNFKTMYITKMNHMFYQCDIKGIDLFSFKTINVKYMNYMFAYCKNLIELDISFFNIENVIDISGIFEGCSSLKLLPNNFKKNPENIINIKDMFKECSLIESIPDISKWNIKNVTDISGIFKGCSSLISLPDISKWKTINITNMSEIFKGCSLIESIPDISKWVVKKVTEMNSIFEGCSSLKSLPDISNWKIKSIKYISAIFNGCSSLITLPDISKWNIEMIKDLSCLFEGCSSLKYLPDISKWNTRNITKMKDIFKNCSSLESLPAISKLDMRNVADISGMFKGCCALKSLPDISKWETNNIINISSLFEGCSLIETIPDISKWDIKKVTDMSHMFQGCSSLKSLPDIYKWKIKSPTNINRIFKGCLSLKSLQESEFRNIKIVLTGNTGVGCNSLSRAAIEDDFTENSAAVPNWSYREKSFFTYYKELKVHLWNGPGQEKWKSQFKLFSKGAYFILFVYSVDSNDSFKDLDSRIKLAKEANANKFKGVIIANKKDLYMEQVVDDEQGLEFARNHNFKFYSASAKDDRKGFKDFLEDLVIDNFSSLDIK